jgi:hypothetical protein
MPLGDERLLELWRGKRALALPYFDGREVELFFEDEDELLLFADSIRRFLELGPADRAGATPHVHAYFRDVTAQAGFDWVEEGMENLRPGSEDIWRFVYPTTLGAHESWDVGTRDRTRQFVVLEGNCGWEPEHGILFSWRDGAELVKVSGYDGHATHGHAYDDPSKDNYIYFSPEPEMCTRRSDVTE